MRRRRKEEGEGQLTVATFNRQLTLLKAYPSKRPPQVPQKEELADPWTELPELPMCAVTSPRVSSSKTTSQQQQQQRQRSRLSYEQWLRAKK